MTWCFAGWSHREVQTFSRTVVEEGRLADRLHGELIAVLERVRAAGIDLVLVSASPVAVVVEAAALVGLDADHVVAAQPRFEDDAMVADVHRPIPYATGKVTRLRERIGENRTLYAAFGDNAFDVALLASAQVSVAVRPKARLRARADEVRGLVELSPQP
jgi:phosphatidylglycerophosphatase C